LIEDFINALKNEIRIFSGLTSDRNIDTVYFGGGTPSMLLPKHINEILDTLDRHYALSANPEISIECNPEDILAENNISKILRNAVSTASASESSLSLTTNLNFSRAATMPPALINPFRQR